MQRNCVCRVVPQPYKLLMLAHKVNERSNSIVSFVKLHRNHALQLYELEWSGEGASISVQLEQSSIVILRNLSFQMLIIA